MQIIENRALLLRTRNPEKYRIIPRSQVLGEVKPGLHEVAVHWGLDEARVLKNLGVRQVPSPILREYDWPGCYKPFEHQKQTAAFFTMHRKAFCFSEPGTAKSMAALWAADYLMRVKEVRRVLIICPVSIMRSVWMGDIGKSIIHRSAAVAHHSSGERRIEIINAGYEIIICNYDGLPIVAETLRKDGRFDLIIGDEANAWKSTTTRRWKLLNSLVTPQTYLWLLTGTPAAQSPVDAYGLARLVNPKAIPQFFTGWRDLVMRKVTMFKWVPKEDAYTKVHSALQPAIRYTKAECLDLPPVLVETREVALTAQQTKYYTLLKEQLLVKAAGEVITVANAATAVNKLLQISCGACYTDTRETVEFDCAPRLEVLREVLEETTRKVLVFANYRHSIDTISAWLKKQNVAVECIHGGISVGKRTEIFHAFQTTDAPRVLVLQPQAAAHGVTLTAADTVVFWGPVLSVEQYLQCMARSDRQGQTSSKVTVVHIQGSPIEARMFKQLASKVKDHGALLKIYAEELDEAKVKH